MSSRTFQKKKIIEISKHLALYSSILDPYRGRTNIKTSIEHKNKTLYLQTIKDLNLIESTTENYINIIGDIDKIGVKFFFTNSGWTEYFFLNNHDNSLVINPYQLKAMKILLQSTEFKKPFIKILKCSVI